MIWDQTGNASVMRCDLCNARLWLFSEVINARQECPVLVGNQKPSLTEFSRYGSTILIL